MSTLSDTLEDMQQLVIDEIEYVLRDVSGCSFKHEVIDSDDEIRSLMITVNIKDSEVTHQSSIIIEIVKNDQDYYILFGEDNLYSFTPINFWKALYFNKSDSDESKRIIDNLNTIISNLKNNNSSDKFNTNSPLISRGWK